MSSSTRRDHTPKVNRYLQRIEQLIGNRGRTPSPINSRMKRPITTRNLDHFLKYEFTFKMLFNFMEKNNRVLMRHFFNNLRVHEHHKQKTIYRFVPIEKSSCPHMVVDTGLASKMLTNLLKSFFRNQMKDALQSIQETGLGASHHSFKKVNESPKKQKADKTLSILVRKLCLSQMKTAFFLVKYSSKKQPNLSILLRLAQLEHQQKSLAFRKIYYEPISAASRAKESRLEQRIACLEKGQKSSVAIYEGTYKVLMIILSKNLQHICNGFKLISESREKAERKPALHEIEKKVLKSMSYSFNKIKSQTQPQAKEKASVLSVCMRVGRMLGILQKSINPLRHGFDGIQSHSKGRVHVLVKEVEKVMEFHQNRMLVVSFESVKRSKEKPTRKGEMLQCLHRLHLHQLIEGKIKSKGRKAPKVQKEEAGGWIGEANVFLEEREIFQHRVTDNWHKLQEMLEKKEEDSFKVASTPSFRDRNTIKIP